MPLHHCQNDTVSTQPVPEITARRRRLLSSIGDELPSRLPSRVLPDDLIVYILLRVSVRSLLQFRCVCKSWKTLISDPQFVKNHLRISTSDPTMTHLHLVSSYTTHCKSKIMSCPVKPLFENPQTSVKAVSFDMRCDYVIFGSCNGLLCLYDKYQVCVKLWNPSTRLKSKRVPIDFSPGGGCGIIKYYGFGYDQVNDKYKLLVAAKLDFSKIVTKVYTFGANSWTTVQNFPCTPPRWLGKFFNGTLNWVATRDVSSDQWVILSFDLEKETYREMLLPQQDGDNICNPTLDVSNNCLCVCFKSNKTHWVVWLMKEYGVAESWTKLMMIPSDMFWNPFPGWLPLCISENGVVLAKNSYYSKLFLYDSNSGRFHYPRILSKLGLQHHIYHESLVSPPLW